MLERLNYAPGCYGKAYCYSEDETCGACPYSTECKALQFQAKEQLRQFYGVQAPTRKPVGLPVKVSKLFKELGKTEEEVRDAMLSGKNPYPPNESAVGVVAHCVLSAWSVSRSNVVGVVAKARNLNLETATIYTRYAIQILAHCGAITVDKDKIHLVRAQG